MGTNAAPMSHQLEMKMELAQIEADVVVVLINDATGTGAVHPLWECEMDRRQLVEYAARMALIHNEQAGSGFTSWEIVDHRAG